MAAGSVGRGSALADALTLGVVLNDGLERSGWRITGIKIAEFRRNRPGAVPNGVVMFERETFPLPNRGWGTARWDIQADGDAAFFTGHYDLTHDEAVADFNERGID